METKIIKAVFGGGTSTVTNKRTRTDYGQVLEIIGIDLPDTFECIFSNSNTSAGVGKKQIGSAQRVLIPDEYLATGQTIYAWVLVHDSEDDGRHMYNVRIPVADMPDTSPEEPTPVEQSVISQAITALNSAVDTTTQKAQEASESADRAEHAAEGVEGYAERAEAAQSAAESARDRATQAETSARTSAATATEKASEAISSATTASQSALTAENASESAQEYATASAESASQASQSADTASGKASDASGYASNASTSAQTASQKASEAAQSASTAVQAKTDAETAKTASETAQGLAETARNEAITAKTSAESARDEAQGIADGITGKVEQIDSNTERIESLEDDRYKPYAVDTASGSIASFPDGADDIPLKSCIVQIEPVQEGSGDPSPDNIRPITGWTECEVQRTGKNLLEMFGKNGKNLLSKNTFVKAGTYIVSTSGINGNYATYVRKATTEGSITGDIIANKASQGDVTFTLEKDTNLMVQWYAPNDSSADLTGKTFQLELGSTPTPYEPYTGHTYPITFPTEAGTVYGGTLDVTSGVLAVDRAGFTLTGNEAWFKVNTVNSHWRFGVLNNQIATTPNRDAISNVYKSLTANETYEGKMGVSQNSVGNILYVCDERYETVENFKTYLATADVFVSYTLITPITYTLTPQEITSLLGTNNLWADTGDTEVEYRADVKLYINKKIAEAISALS